MCAEMYNALLESWRGQYRWHQTRHAYDGVKVSDIYAAGRVCGDRGTLEVSAEGSGPRPTRHTVSLTAT